MRAVLRITAKHLYGIEPESMVRNTKDGRIGQVFDVDAEHAMVRWSGEKFSERVCFGDIAALIFSDKDPVVGEVQ